MNLTGGITTLLLTGIGLGLTPGADVSRVM
jgi:hypothetical protein